MSGPKSNPSRPRRMADYDILVNELRQEVQRQQNLSQAAIDAGENLRQKLTAAGADVESRDLRIKQLENEMHGLAQKLQEQHRCLMAEMKVSEKLGKMVMTHLRQASFMEVG